jgi:hypothetical protein
MGIRLGIQGISPMNNFAAAERMARYRDRRRKKLRCLTIEIREREIDALIRGRFLNHEARNDRNAVINALYRLLDQILN